MTTIVTRAGKGGVLSHAEMDANLTNLNSAKLEAGTPGTNIANTPAGTISSVTVQAALNELDTLKLPAASGVLKAGDNLTGGLNGKLTSVSSGPTPDIFATTIGNLIDYTDTFTCTGFQAAPQAGAERTLVIASTGALFTAGPNLLIDGVVSGENYEAVAGDKVIVRAVTTTQFRLTIQRYIGTAEPYALLQEQQPQNTAGGTFTSGVWQTRALNTEVHDSQGICSLSFNAFTLQPGTYRFRGTAVAYYGNEHRTKIRNTTVGSDVALGISAYSVAAVGSSPTNSEVVGRVTITSATAFELQHRIGTTKATNGFGIASNLATEVYSQMEIWKEV